MKLHELRKLNMSLSEMYVKVLTIWEQEKDQDTKDVLKDLLWELALYTKELTQLEHDKFSKPYY